MDRGTDQKSIKNMTTNYVVVLVILAVIAFCNFYIMRASIKGEQTTAAVINVSGRQRMLLQRSAMFAQRLLVNRDEPSRKIFLETVEKLRRSHDGLISGDKELELPGIRSEEVRSIFFDSPVNLDKQVREFINEARAFAADPADQVTFQNPHLLYIENAAATGLLDSLDTLVRKYQSESEGKITWIATLTFLLFIVSIIVLVFMGLAVFRPMVRRIRLEVERITGAEARISAVVASMMDGLVTFDEGGVVETINSAACLIFGLTEEQIIGESAQRLIPGLFWQGRVDPNAIDMVMRETNARRSDGTEFPLEYSLGEAHIGGKRIYVASVRDISERKQIEQEIIAQNIMLEESARDEHLLGSAMALFTSTYDKDKILNGTLELLAENHPYPVSALYLYDEWAAKLICRASYCASDSLKKELSIGDGVVGQSIIQKEALVLDSEDNYFSMSIETGIGLVEPTVIIVSPIFYQNKIMGVLTVASSTALSERDRL
ncbi:MAG: PAS domain S-box protein, partial [Thermodesulfobacteriota bacterium]